MNEGEDAEPFPLLLQVTALLTAYRGEGLKGFETLIFARGIRQ